jgi:hypothetical protein
MSDLGDVIEASSAVYSRCITFAPQSAAVRNDLARGPANCGLSSVKGRGGCRNEFRIFAQVAPGKGSANPARRVQEKFISAIRRGNDADQWCHSMIPAIRRLLRGSETRGLQYRGVTKLSHRAGTLPTYLAEEGRRWRDFYRETSS